MIGIVVNRRPASREARPAGGAAGLAVATALMLAGCAPGAPQPGIDVSAAAPTTSDALSAAAELRPLASDQLESILAASAEANLVPGALAVVTTPEGTITAAYGTTVLGETRQPQPSDVFRIGSVTKTMVGIAILQMVEEGELAFHDPVARFAPGVPSVPGGDEITIRDLLQMRSGLHNYLDTDGFATRFHTDMTTVWSPRELVALGTGYPAVSAPAETFDYSNTNTTLLGMVAEQIEGRPLGSILRDRLFEPLGMDDTQLPAATTTTLPDPQVQGYQYGAFPINHGPLLSDTERAAARAGTVAPTEATRQSPSWSWAAGGVVSTADDLMIWARALGQGALLGVAERDAWMTDMHPMDPARGGGGPQYGLAIEQARFGQNRIYLHEGELPGFNTFVGTDPAHGVEIVIWTNLALSVDGEPTAKAIAGDVIGALYRTPLDTPAEAVRDR